LGFGGKFGEEVGKEECVCRMGVGGKAKGIAEKVKNLGELGFSGMELEGRFWDSKWWTSSFVRSGSFCWSSSSSIIMLLHQQSFRPFIF